MDLSCAFLCGLRKVSLGVAREIPGENDAARTRSRARYKGEQGQHGGSRVPGTVRKRRRAAGIGRRLLLGFDGEFVDAGARMAGEGRRRTFCPPQRRGASSMGCAGCG